MGKKISVELVFDTFEKNEEKAFTSEYRSPFKLGDSFTVEMDECDFANFREAMYEGYAIGFSLKVDPNIQIIKRSCGTELEPRDCVGRADG